MKDSLSRCDFEMVNKTRLSSIRSCVPATWLCRVVGVSSLKPGFLCPEYEVGAIGHKNMNGQPLGYVSYMFSRHSHIQSVRDQPPNDAQTWRRLISLPSSTQRKSLSVRSSYTYRECSYSAPTRPWLCQRSYGKPNQDTMDRGTAQAASRRVGASEVARSAKNDAQADER